ncbi:hypothetical protein PYH37_002439 [Sinorhizobium numidicum]|uniref:Uncharacterized protein n=1 Tax=Sinorhizobium numidicum TaxID=680248 RepID=A0ABY8D080_9HYPH|nr:hypothetical protein [Sinorhizobium numidicum]WEX77628.1 hypothetical protein PYH37_002439 [Sinorhizobium numidicum]WEX84288.1 hypothetical protein PYH38_003152 [Sinorhizobium numidicum]
MLPIVTNRSAVGSGDESAPSVRRTSLPAPQRAEAIQKILDALSRHLSGREVLSRDALVKLIEDLARVLKFPPLPQENGRAFVRRLIDFLESMPMPERLLVERQLGGRSLAHRIAVLTGTLASRSTKPASAGSAAAPGSLLPPDQSGIRNLPLQATPSRQPAAAKPPSSSEVALLQAMLKKTFGADEGGMPIEEVIEGTPTEAAPRAPAQTEPERAPTAAELRAHVPTDTDDAVAAEISAEIAQEDGGEAQSEPLLSLPDGSEDDLHDIGGNTGALPPRDESIEVVPLAPSEEIEKSVGETETAMGERGGEETTDGFESDGTYGRPLAGREAGRPQQRVAVLAGETGGRSAPPPADTIKPVIRDSLSLPRTGAEDDQPTMASERPAVQAPSGIDPPQRLRDSAVAARSGTVGTQPFADPISENPIDDRASDIPAIQPRPQRLREDPATQQALSRLVEAGFSREAIPFAMVPYLPAPEEAEDETEQRDKRQAGDDGGRGTDAKDGDRDQQQQARGSDDSCEHGTAEEPGTVDAYDLYRKLGGLG